MLKIIDTAELRRCQCFIKSKPSFKSLSSFIIDDSSKNELKIKLLNYFSSSKAIRKILGSRIGMGQKKIMIKYL